MQRAQHLTQKKRNAHDGAHAYTMIGDESVKQCVSEIC